MRTKFLFIFLLTICLVPYRLLAQKIDTKLEQKLRALTQNFQGDIGIYVKNLKTQKSVLIQADSIFPTASIVKIPILVGVFDKKKKDN